MSSRVPALLAFFLLCLVVSTGYGTPDDVFSPTPPAGYVPGGPGQGEGTPPCDVECPPEGVLEGEPPCQDDYRDRFNGGCVHGWSPIQPEPDGSAVICGRSCTYDYQGLSYRDTDFYHGTAAGGTVTGRCQAEFPLQFVLIYGGNCGHYEYILTYAEPCETVELTWNFEPGQEVIFWAGPSVFTGVPESDYTLEASGLTATVHGACCVPGGGCFMASPFGCEYHAGRFLGDATVCEPDPCGANPPGACCAVDGSCQVLDAGACTQQQGQWQGPGSTCTPNPCEQPPSPVETTTWGRIKSVYGGER